MNAHRTYLWIFFFAVMSLSACSKSKAGDKDSFRIYILQDDWHTLKLGYMLEESWPILEKVDLNKTMRVITPDDIQTYNWSTQTITLTMEASNFFNRIPYENKLAILVSQPAFVATFNDQRLYGGCIVAGTTAMDLDYPIILTDFSTNPVVFTLRPYIDQALKYEDFEPSKKKIIEIKEIYDLFDRLGKLTY